MFRIPSAYIDAPSFKDAAKMMTDRGRGDLLEGLKSIERCYEEYVASTYSEEPLFETDDDFYYTWSYELNAYNVVFENMSKLFATKETV